MAFGFTPKYTTDLPIHDLTQEQALVLTVEAATKMGWNTSYISASGLIAHTDNGMFRRNGEIRVEIENGIASLKSTTTGNEMWDAGTNKKNIEGFTETFNELKAILSPEELAAKYQELKDNGTIQENDIFTQAPPTSTAQVKGFFSIFIPQKGFFVTPLLIDVNILVFILMVMNGVSFISPDTASLLKWGANFRPMTLEGEWWRLITNTFLHIGIFHLLMNMYALLYIGILLEPHLGRARFLSAYLLTGIAASTTSLWWHDLTVSAGASGAIFGMYGVFLALLTGNFIEKHAQKSLLASIGVFVAYNLANGMKGGIDNSAHIGGLVSGLIIGYVFIPSLHKLDAKNLKFSTIGILTVVILASSFIAYKNIPDDIGMYDAKLKAFSPNEIAALEVLKLPDDAPKTKFLTGLKDSGIYYWNENIKLIDEVEKFNLPDVLRKRDKLLKEYCEERVKCYELMYKAIDENTGVYKEDIDECNKQIKATLDEIKEKNK